MFGKVAAKQNDVALWCHADVTHADVKYANVTIFRKLVSARALFWLGNKNRHVITWYENLPNAALVPKLVSVTAL